jgi:creatinine amidohydrolase
MKVTGFGTASFEGAEIDVPIELAEITPDAVFGADARACSGATGAKLVEALTELGARFVCHYAEQTR